jgi:hypothetical protein
MYWRVQSVACAVDSGTTPAGALCGTTRRNSRRTSGIDSMISVECAPADWPSRVLSPELDDARSSAAA